MVSSKDGDVSCSPSWSPAVNWTVAGGCLENTVAYESFYSPINDEETVESDPKLPLILRRPSPESGPCEITLCFAEKHEIRQVYVRSTARVYEMYHVTNTQDENEYFCTVRCGAALRDEEVLHTDGIESVSAHLNGSNGVVAEASSKRESNLNTNEDEWVEVKAPDGPTLVHKSDSSTSKSGANSVMIRQDLYEATAEITDANPCTSLTIRLLSLQNKSLVYVDEIYVFANPVDLEEESLAENSAQNSQSSLMSMLVPTLLQLSKTTGSSKNNDGRNSNPEGVHLLPKIRSEPLDSTSSVTGLRQPEKSCVTVDDEVKLQEEKESDTSVCQPDVHLQVPVKDKMHNENEPLLHIENILGQLVCRMDRIENCFLRFEENMLKPINSIDGRLKQVEQQLEILTKESHGSEWPSCYRMSAPSFSANGSSSNSFYNSGNDHPSCGPIEADRKEIHSVSSPIPLDISNSVDSSLLRPSLVVTAPEFSNIDDGDQECVVASAPEFSNIHDGDQECVVATAPEFSNGNDDDQENQIREVPVDASKSKAKPSLDDALASALAQFTLSSSSISTPEHSETVAVKPPDLPNEDGNNHKKYLASNLSTSEIDHTSCSHEIDDIQYTKNSASASLSSANGWNSSPSQHDCSAKIGDGDGEQVLECQECMYEKVNSEVGTALDERSVLGMEALGNVEVDETCEDFVSEKSILIHPFPHHPDNDSDKTNVDANADANTIEVTKGSHDIDIVHDVLGFSRDMSIVNFEIPILDVSFTSKADSSSDNNLKELLGETTESSHEASCPKESDDVTPFGEQGELILVEEEGQENTSSTNGPISVDMNYYTIMSDPLIAADGENLKDYHNRTVIWNLI
ncbi:hypothetical protein IC582_002311 [Cucumis melo]|uniref:Uncharacterized protein n=1 Tax=Cucumis melo var. makuwa TaxID=1194695 RepID=A0A5D3CJN8_CUCMM|nr:uncharacterized protein E5676_scaffold459G00750 [Cucumis melo var. makuwa]